MCTSFVQANQTSVPPESARWSHLDVNDVLRAVLEDVMFVSSEAVGTSFLILMFTNENYHFLII